MYRPPLMPQSPEMWRFPAVGVPHPQAMGLFAGRKGGDASVEGSTVTEQSWGSKGFRPRRGGPDDESTKLDSTSSGDGRNDSGANRGFCNMLAGQNPQTVETPKRDFIHVKARRGQATDSHSLAERERREKISERMKILQDLVPGCNKVIGKASILDEIINYIQALQHQVEFLSMKLEAVNAPLSTSIKVFPPPRDVWYSAHKQRGSMSRIRGRGDGFKCRLAATLEELRRWKETTQPWIIRYKDKTDYCCRLLIEEEARGQLDIFLSWDVSMFNEIHPWRISKSHVGELLFGLLISETVINAYAALLANRSRQNKKKFAPFAYIPPTALYQFENGLIARCFSQLEHIKNDNIQSIKSIMAPVCNCKHWYLLYFDFKKKEAVGYNSMAPKRNDDGLVKRYLKVVRFHVSVVCKVGKGKDIAQWNFRCDANCPKQSTDSVDCAVFVIKFMDYLSRYEEFDFTQDDMHRFRAELGLELCTGKLL